MHTGDIVCAPRGKPSVGLRCIKCIQRVEEIERQRGGKKSPEGNDNSRTGQMSLPATAPILWHKVAGRRGGWGQK